MKNLLCVLAALAVLASAGFAEMTEIAGFDSASVGDNLKTYGYPVSTSNSWSYKWVASDAVSYAELNISEALGVPGSPAYNQFSAVGWDTAGQYFSMKVNLNGGSTFGNDVGLYYGGIKPSSTGPAEGYTTLSVDGGEEQIIETTYTLSSSSYRNQFVDISSYLEGASSAEIRWYLSGATSSSGTCRIGDYYLSEEYTDAGLWGSVVTDPNYVDPVVYDTYTYGWEDGFSDVLDLSGNIYEPQNAIDPNGLSNSLQVQHYPVSGTPTVDIAWIKGLQDGDKITASFRTYDVTPGVSPSVKIAAAYADSVNLLSDLGSAGEGAEYSGDPNNAWTTLEQEWTFGGNGIGADAMMVQALFFSDREDPNDQLYWIDDLVVTVPDHCTVVFPNDVYKAEDYSQSTYSWANFAGEDSESAVLLGSYGMINAELETSDSYDGDGLCASVWDATESFTMSSLQQAMKRGALVSYSTTVTPEGYIAMVTGLSAGDYVKASAYAKTYSGQDSNTGLRLWSNYIYDAADVTSYAGTAGGFGVYSTTDEWTKLSKRWAFTDEIYTDVDGVQHTPVGIAFSVRAYTDNGEGGLVDTIEIEAPATATVTFPDPSGSFVSGGLPENDLNLDGIVDLYDFAELAGSWLQCNLQPCN